MKKLQRGEMMCTNKGTRVRLICVISLVGVFVVSGISFGFDDIIDAGILGEAKIERVWTNKLPLREGEHLSKILLIGNRVYGLSNKNYIVGFNEKDGEVIFCRQLAPAGVPIIGLDQFNNSLYSVISSRLVELDANLGLEKRSRRLVWGVTCPAVRTENYYYFAGIDKRLHVLSLDTGLQAYELGTGNNSIINCVAATEDFVIFSTDAGNVYCMRAGEISKIWNMTAGGSIPGDLVLKEDSLYFSSADTFVYKVNAYTGKLDWKYQCQDVLDKSPNVTKEVVYQQIQNKGLVAIDAVSGKMRWEVNLGQCLLCEADSKAYVLTKGRKLVVMDNAENKKLFSVDFRGVDKYVTNVHDSMMYIGNSDGRIACLKPLEK
jgi:hypothetical protein